MTTVRLEVRGAVARATAVEAIPADAVVGAEAIDDEMVLCDFCDEARRYTVMDWILALIGGLLLTVLFLYLVIRFATRERQYSGRNDGSTPDHQGYSSGGGPGNSSDSGGDD